MDSKIFFLTFNDRLNRMMALVTPLGMLTGFLFHGFFLPLKPFVTPLFAFITLTGVLGMTLKDFSNILLHPLMILLSLVFSHVVVPLVVFTTSSIIFGGQAELIAGFMLLCSIPTAVVSYIWSSIYLGNGPLSLTIIIVDTLLSPFVTPLTMKVFTRSDVVIDVSGIMLSMFYMVVLPAIIGILLNTATKGYMQREVKFILNPFTKIALFFVVAINVSQVVGKISFDAETILVVAVTLLLTAGGLFVYAHVFRLMGLSKENQVSLTFSVGMRNISAALVLAIDFFSPVTAIPVISGVLLQQMSAAIMGRILFGRKKDGRK